MQTCVFYLKIKGDRKLNIRVEGIYNTMKQNNLPSIEYCCKNLINFSIFIVEKLVCTLNCRKIGIIDYNNRSDGQ